MQYMLIAKSLKHLVRDTLEQIDIARRFIQEYPSTFQYCDTPSCARAAFKSGRIASMIGIEGGHQVGSKFIAPLSTMINRGLLYRLFGSNQANVRFGRTLYYYDP